MLRIWDDIKVCILCCTLNSFLPYRSFEEREDSNVKLMTWHSADLKGKCKMCFWDGWCTLWCIFFPVSSHRVWGKMFGELFEIAHIVDEVLDLFKASWLPSWQKVMFSISKIQKSLILPAPLKYLYNGHEAVPSQELPCYPVQK